MYKNNLIIGLGGSGGLSVAAFRRTTVIRHNEFKAMTKPSSDSVAFEYLYIDTSDDMWSNKGLWTVFGQNVRLDLNDHVSIKDSGSTFQQALSCDRITPWLGDYDKIQSQRSRNASNDHQKLSGAEQMRRFGRVLFSLQAQKISENITSKINELLTHNTEDGITFHIFATLGGGTGSGGLIDLITLVNKLARDKNTSCKVFLYLFVGGDNAKSSDVGFFYQNEYAALRDLNALMVGRYNPHMATYVTSTGKCDTFRGVADDPVTQAFICSEDAPVRINKIDDQATFMAEACFDIVYSNHCGLGANIQRAFTGEDVNTSHGAEDNARSYRFATVGVKRWCVPTDRMTEIMQHLFRHVVIKYWLNGDMDTQSKELRMHFSADEMDASVNPIIDIPGIMSSQNSTLNLKVNGYLREHVKAVADAFTKADEAKKTKDTLKGLNAKVVAALKAIAAAVENKTALQKQHQDQIKRDENYIAQTLDTALASIRQWHGNSGVWGLRDMQKCLGKLKSYLVDLKDRPIPAIKPTEGKTLGNMEKRSAEWEKIAILSTLLPKQENMLVTHQSEALGVIENAINATYRPTVEKVFYDSLIKRIEKMTEALKLVIEDLEKACKDAETEYGVVLGSLKQTAEYATNVVKYDFDETNLNNIIQFIRGDASFGFIDPIMQQVETSCWEPVWTPNEATTYYTTQPESEEKVPTLLDKLDSKECAWKLSRELVREITDKDPNLKDIYHDSLYDRLHQRWRNVSEDARADEVVRFIKRLCTSATINAVDPLIRNGNTAPRKALAVGLPKADGRDYQRFIKTTIANNVGNGIRKEAISSYEVDGGNEIRLLYCEYWMPARFAQVVATIVAERYHESMRGKDAVEVERVSYLCNIDEEGRTTDEYSADTTRPSLLKPLAANKEFKNRFEMLKLLPVAQGSPMMIAGEGKDENEQDILFVAAEVNLPEGQAPQYEQYAASEMNNPSNDIIMHTDKVLAARVATMDREERAAFEADYNKSIVERINRIIEEEGKDKMQANLDPRVRAMQAHLNFCKKYFEKIRVPLPGKA